MKKYTLPELLRLLGLPALTVALGAVLLFSPDTASALGGRLLGWFFLLAAAIELLSAGSPSQKPLVVTLLMGLLGLWLVMNPLSLTKGIGRVLGLAFFIWGAGKVRKHPGDRMYPRVLTAGAVAVLGIALFLIPMTATRLVLRIAGVMTISLGIADGYNRLHGRKQLDRGDDPRIIDVEKL